MFTDHGLDGIPVDSQNVRFLRTPDEFYTTLVNKTKTAKQRIYLTSLYLGVGPLERQLVDELENTLDKNPKLEVKMLFDYLRGTRGGALGTAGMLAERKLRNAEVYLFHTPDLRGTLKRILPERMNEIVGLQHMKFFIFDDSIIISGANLSDTYFTNRQDRYVVIEDCPRLIEFFIAIYDCIASCSYKLVTNGDYKMNSTAQEELIKTDVRKFRREMNSKINAVIGDLSTDSQQNAETMIFPFLQMKPFGIDQEERVMERLLKNSKDDWNLTFATGYFNFDDKYSDLIIRQSQFPSSIILAAPDANGFFGARGISGGIPSLYVYISLLFYRKVQELFKPITMYEWSRSGWSFHAKGIWIEPRDSTEWFATVIGSSNYGYRSTNRDLESQLLIFTKNDKLRREMAEERQNLMEFATKIESSTFERADRYVPIWLFLFAPRPPVRHGESFVTENKKKQIHLNPKFYGNELVDSRLDDSVRLRIPIYRFPSIKICALISRMKLVQTIASVCFAPYQTYAFMNDQISNLTFFGSLGLAVIAPITLFAFTQTFNRIIGVISIDQEQELVRFGSSEFSSSASSYLSFWGGRSNITAHLDSVVPLTDTYDLDTKMKIVKLDLGKHGSLLLSLRKCEIVDEELATEVFGSIEYFETKES
ncbi:CDP-diacylglycerol--glycerol-3-phosphate 3-phosphatidyltransferase [Aphelenchoides besseyi]|nr:CDP-diacylglycerol--glycerol-3-phosphate 3-phosphatidyltransferase [Aphelenchoides besseyi]